MFFHFSTNSFFKVKELLSSGETREAFQKTFSYYRFAMFSVKTFHNVSIKQYKLFVQKNYSKKKAGGKTRVNSFKRIFGKSEDIVSAIY